MSDWVESLHDVTKLGHLQQRSDLSHIEASVICLEANCLVAYATWQTRVLALPKSWSLCRAVFGIPRLLLQKCREDVTPCHEVVCMHKDICTYVPFSVQ